ncbi:MAG: cupin domain-containing protein [Actinomycetota bacterium]|nr:cupin domain-containing protein [Actinomycetota bacterium]
MSSAGRRLAGHSAASREVRSDELGRRLREARIAAGLGVRELARRVALSASLISQIELNRVAPSVGTLYAIATTLGISMDSLFGEAAHVAAATRGAAPPPGADGAAFVLRAAERRRIVLARGVCWELLMPRPEPGVEFLEVTYPIGAGAGAAHPICHRGRDYCVILAGTLVVQLGADELVLEPGDSLALDASEPHRFANLGEVPVRSVWMVLDPRASH